MSDFFDEIEAFGADEDSAVLATLVATRGTSPRKEGARMWVRADGAIAGSVTIGGCVDAYVLHATEQMPEGPAARLLSLDLGDEDAHALGLSCAGTVDVLVQRVDLRAGAWIEAMQRVRDAVTAGGRAVTAIVLPRAPSKSGIPDVGEGSTGVDETRSGVPLVIGDDGSLLGTTGEGGLDAGILERGLAWLRLGGAGTDTVETAAGETRVYFEVHGAGPLLAIVGAGPIAASLATIGRALGQHVVVIDGRARFADPRQFPAAHEVRVGAPASVLAELGVDGSSAIVLVAHDYKFDLPVLRAVLDGPAAYIGMLGSRKRAARMLAMLEEEGISGDRLSRIHTPIGLDIGGRSAAEIALSIAAEIVAVRHGRSGGSMRARAVGPS
ncbi:MAG: XdhC family protein [Gemmatimonadota bacterium]|jgi:xanthine dehydrogenase accessory factor